MLVEEAAATLRHDDDDAGAVAALRRDEASLVRILPHRETRARRAPGVQDVRVGPRARPDPFEQIEDQRVRRLRHGGFTGL